MKHNLSMEWRKKNFISVFWNEKRFSLQQILRSWALYKKITHTFFNVCYCLFLAWNSHYAPHHSYSSQSNVWQLIWKYKSKCPLSSLHLHTIHKHGCLSIHTVSVEYMYSHNVSVLALYISMALLLNEWLTSNSTVWQPND